MQANTHSCNSLSFSRYKIHCDVVLESVSLSDNVALLTELRFLHCTRWCRLMLVDGTHINEKWTSTNTTQEGQTNYDKHVI